MRSPYRSDVFEEYAKIAEDAGLIAKADETEEHSKYKNDPAPRTGSDDISTIEALYGVKPEGMFDTDKSIIEIAHPEPVVIAPAYDRINALVENELEGQNIRINRTLSPTTVKNINYGPKLARKELLMELIRVANDMDSRDLQEIRILADSCINQLEKKNLNKYALSPLIVVGAIVLAGVYAWQHLDFANAGTINNIDRALKKLDDLKTNSWYESDVDGEVQQEVNTIEEHLNTIRPKILDFNNLMDQIRKPRTLEDAGELDEFMQDVENHGTDIQTALEALKKETDNTLPLLKAAAKNFADRDYQAQHTKPTWLASMSGRVGEAIHGGASWSLFTNEFLTAVEALNPLLESLQSMEQTIDKMPQIIAEQKTLLTNAQAATQTQSQANTTERQGTVESVEYPKENEDQTLQVETDKEIHSEEAPYRSGAENSDNMQYSQIFHALNEEPSDAKMRFLKEIMPNQ